MSHGPRVFRRPAALPRHDVLTVPDADRPTPERSAELAAALREIDRRWGTQRERRFLRAAAAYNFGDLMAWHREMQVGLAEAADQFGLPRSEVTRVVLPAAERLLRRSRGPN